MKRTLFPIGRTAVFAAILSAILPLAPLKAVENSGTLSRADKSFVVDAYRGGLGEVKIGRLAEAKATTPEAKKLAQRLISDHERTNEELKNLAQAKGITLPDEPASEAQATFTELKTRKGAQFDKLFADDAVKDHEKDIDAFKKIEKETKDEHLRTFIKKTIPVLEEHLSLAKTASGSVQ